MAKMRAVIASTAFILRQQQEVAKSLFVSQSLLSGKTKHRISLVFTSLMLFFFRNE